jgi:hypothetical protein
MARAEPPQTLAGWQRSRGGHPAPRPTWLGSGRLGPRVNYAPVVMIILTFGLLHFVIT